MKIKMNESHMNKLLIVLLFSLIFSAVPAIAQSVNEALNQFGGKILVLRHPLENNSQQYDANGKPLNGTDEGPWTVYGGILIDHVSLRADQLRIEGRRMLFLFEKGQLKLMEFKTLKDRKKAPFPPQVKLEIKLEHPLDSDEQAHAVLNRIFFLNSSDFLNSLPEFWRKCLADQLTYDPSQAQETEFRWKEPSPPKRELVHMEPAATRDSNTDPDRTVFHVGPGVSAPRATFTPEPQFSEIARYEKFQGVLVASVIVGTDGRLHGIRIVRPLGLGLDDSALSALQTWRFDPGKHDGKPVAVEMSIEVSFNLY